MLNKFICAKNQPIIALVLIFLCLPLNTQPALTSYSDPQVLELKKRTLARASKIRLTDPFKKKFPNCPTNQKRKPQSMLDPFSFTTVAIATLASTAACVIQGIRSTNIVGSLCSMVPALIGIMSLTILTTEKNQGTTRHQPSQGEKAQKTLALKDIVINLEQIRQAILIEQNAHDAATCPKGIRNAAQRYAITEALLKNETLQSKISTNSIRYDKMIALLKKIEDDEKLIDNLSILANQIVEDSPLGLGQVNKGCQMIDKSMNKPATKEKLREIRIEKLKQKNLGSRPNWTQKIRYDSMQYGIDLE